jgi:hypothetical protein
MVAISALAPAVARADPTEPTDPPPNAALPAPTGDGPWVGYVTRRGGSLLTGEAYHFYDDQSWSWVAHTVADGTPAVTTMTGNYAWYGHTHKHTDFRPFGLTFDCDVKDTTSEGQAHITPNFPVNLGLAGSLNGLAWGFSTGYPYVMNDVSVYGPVTTQTTGNHLGSGLSCVDDITSTTITYPKNPPYFAGSTPGAPGQICPVQGSPPEYVCPGLSSQAIFITRKTAYTGYTGGETLTIRARREPCDRTVDTDGGGVSDCDEIDDGTNPFEAADDHKVTLTVAHRGAAGSVSGAGIDCGADCSEDYKRGTVVGLTAAPAANSVFDHWEGACTGSGACLVAMNADKAVTAVFAADRFTLGLGVQIPGNGEIRTAQVSCRTACSRDYAAGEVVAVTVEADPGWELDHWIGACTGSGPCAVTMDGDKTVTAVLAATVLLTVRVDGPGAVHGLDFGPDGCEAFCARSFRIGTQITLLAAPDEPHDGFLRWDGCVSPASDQLCRLTLTANTEAIASFDPVVTYAPSLRFHPDETHWPMDASRFVASSELRWANLRTSKVKPCVRADPLFDVAGGVSAPKLRSGGYQYNYCSRRRMPRPPHSRRPAPWGPKKYAFFNSAELTAPSRKETLQPAGLSGFYLDLKSCPLGVVPAPSVKTCTKTKRKSGQYTNAPKMYIEYKPKQYVIYWFFFGKNDVLVDPPGLGSFKDLHEGDWEHITVLIDGANRATDAVYYQHYCSGEKRGFGSLELRSDDPASVGTHPTVYVARGAHASYPHRGLTGYHPFACTPLLDGWGLHDSVGKGLTWRTWQNGAAGFAPADLQLWYGFGGGWGSKADGSFWGPLGPGGLKLVDALAVK